MRKPCNAFKFGPNKDFSEVSGQKEESKTDTTNKLQKLGPALVRSPFNMTSNLSSEIQHEAFKTTGRKKEQQEQVNYDTLINYWNNNQVIHLAGPASGDSY
jgi:hypothetical protein